MNRVGFIMLNLLKLTLTIYFRGIFIITILGKLIFPTTFKSFIISLFKYYDIQYIFLYIEKETILYFLFLTILLIETYLLYLSYIDLQLFAKYLIVFFIFTTVFSLALFTQKVPFDCGCFGNIFTFENSFDKLLFNFISLIFSVIFFLSNFNIVKPVTKEF
jgi:hypothetical protein